MVLAARPGDVRGAWMGGLVCATLLAALALPVTAAEQLLDGIAAQVGNDIVMISDVDELAGPIEQRLRRGRAHFGVGCLAERTGVGSRDEEIVDGLTVGH